MKPFLPYVLSAGLIISIIIIITGTTLVFKNNPHSINFEVPYIKYNKPKTTACLSPLYMMNAWFDIEGIHEFNDTLDLTDITGSLKKEIRFEFYENPKKENENNFTNENLIIVVDTINEISIVKRPIWANYLFHLGYDDKRKLRQDDTLVMEVKSFPIYIVNSNTSKSATLGVQDGSAMIITQALDKDNNWRDIEYWSNSWCGNSYGTTIIPPEHYAFTRGVKCSGEERTKCRLKLMNGDDSLFSNEFYMNINGTQFMNPKEEGE